jgi:3-hydroxyisobutyrate dehydrogenase-like beta-hydroxyacid dehydrogenase
VADSLADVLRVSDHVLVLPPDAAAVRSVLLAPGHRNLLADKALAIAVAMSPEECLKLATDIRALGGRVSDIQITTFPAKVRARDSEFLLACNPQDRATWWAVFGSLGTRLFDVGVVGNACKAQLGIALSSAFLMSAISYSVAGFARMGLPIDVIRDLLVDNLDIRIPQADYAVTEMAERRYGDGPWTVENMVALLAAVGELYRRAAAKGLGKRNITAVYGVLNPDGGVGPA